MHRVPHVILHLRVHLIMQFKDGGLQLAKDGGFPEDLHVSFIGPYHLTSAQQDLKFYMQKST